MFQAQKWIWAVMLGLCVLGAGSSASAGHYGYGSPCYYKTVVKQRPFRVAYQQRVVAYKPCGTPYYTWRTYYRTVYKPVSYQVLVCP